MKISSMEELDKLIDSDKEREAYRTVPCRNARRNPEKNEHKCGNCTMLTTEKFEYVGCRHIHAPGGAHEIIDAESVMEEGTGYRCRLKVYISARKALKSEF